MSTPTPCLLLAAPRAIRSLVLDYVDDLTAVRCLATCRSQYANYHHYPVKRVIALKTFLEAVNLDARSAQLEPLRRSGALTARLSLPCLGLRASCCNSGSSKWGVHRRGYRVPRVTRLRDGLWDLRPLQYLQHLTEVTVCWERNWPLGHKYTLPHSLRALQLNSSPDLVIKHSTLPPHLTSLAISAVANMPLPAGLLPQSLRSLYLMAGYDTQFGIGAGVLPSGLHRLELFEWTLSLSDVQLPSTVAELVVHELSDCDRPTLVPLPQLELLSIGGAFNRSLVGVLPSSLRVLRLTGRYRQPLIATMFACTPQLEELHLGVLVTEQVSAVDLPRSLHTLRLGRWEQLRMADAAEAPPQLRRVQGPVCTPTDRLCVDHFERLGFSTGLYDGRDAEVRETQRASSP